jgi:hypothetical protein
MKQFLRNWLSFERAYSSKRNKEIKAVIAIDDNTKGNSLIFTMIFLFPFFKSNQSKNLKIFLFSQHLIY